MKLKKKSLSVSGVVRNLSEIRFISFFWVPKNLYVLAPVVQTMDSTIHRINHYPLDNSIGFASVYQLDSGDLSGG